MAEARIGARRSNARLWLAGGWLLVALLAAIFAPLVAPHDPLAQDLMLERLPPFWLQGAEPGYWLGTDSLGRDLLSRLIFGGRVAFVVAFAAAVAACLVGSALGLVAGYFGGWVDRLLMHVTDVFMAFPGILLAIAFAAVLGPGLGNLVLALCLTSWVGYARLTRAQALSLRHQQHVLAAESLGAPVPRIMGRHMLPLLAAPLVVEATYSIAGLVIAEASLSFLGLGIQAPAASWGAMLRDGVRYLLVAPHYVLAVGLSLMSLVLAVNVLGDKLRDRLDVKR